MRPLRYSINVTLDGCCDHEAITPSPELHHYAADGIERADALLFGRVIYQMMEEAWRPVAQTGVAPAWMPDWMVPFAHTIDAAKKYVVSDTLDSVDWNAELIRGRDLVETVKRLKQQTGRGISLSGVKLPLALAEAGLIDEYEFIVTTSGSSTRRPSVPVPWPCGTSRYAEPGRSMRLSSKRKRWTSAAPRSARVIRTCEWTATT